MQKRKRGRPRKLSGSSNGNEDYEDDAEGGMPEEMLEVKMDGGYSGNEGSDENTNRENEDDSNNVSATNEWVEDKVRRKLRNNAECCYPQETESKGPNAKNRRVVNNNNNDHATTHKDTSDRTASKDQENTGMSMDSGLVVS